VEPCPVTLIAVTFVAAHPMTMNDMTPQHTLKRELGVFGATMVGLGSMVGAGVFVSIGIAAGITGPSIVLAIALAAIVATCNALSSAQLAASMPVSGGTYEYGYAYLNPWFGFTAGWMFLCAKTASAATAGLGFAGYLLHGLGVEGMIVTVAVLAVVALTGIVLAGIRRSNRANIAIVSTTLLALVFFIAAGLLVIWSKGSQPWLPFFRSPSDSAFGPLTALFHATALMFVAFTGYARIATLGEEVREPRRTIPRAIVVTLVLSAVLYVAVAAVAISILAPEGMTGAARTEVAPLEVAARTFGIPGATWIVAVGAMTAMLGVLLNLILGLSRVVLAMGRRGDLPGWFAVITRWGSPAAAVVAVGFAIAGLVLLGDVKTTWSFSAFTVLIYYAITNLAALRLPREKRLYSPLVAGAGLAACLFLAFWVERQIWLTGLGLIAIGLIWHIVARRVRERPRAAASDASR
jgi:basic amino acid/polyamine antiporter, APA family